MTSATIRDLRTQFPRLKAILEREGEIVVTDRGRPKFLLRLYTPPAAGNAPKMDYWARLQRHQPRALSAAASRALDDANRGER